MRYFLSISLLISLFLCHGCSTVKNIQESAVNCKYTLLGAQTTDFSLSTISLEVAMAVTNLSKTTAAKMNRFEGKLYINDNEVSDIAFNSYEVRPSSTEVVKTSLVLPYTKIGKNLAGLVTTNSISPRYKVVGKIYFDTPIGQMPFPVIVQQEIKD
jgi:hypothetical protein